MEVAHAMLANHGGDGRRRVAAEAGGNGGKIVALLLFSSLLCAAVPSPLRRPRISDRGGGYNKYSEMKMIVP